MFFPFRVSDLHRSLSLSISVSHVAHHFPAVYDGRDENRTELKERKDSHGSKRLSNLRLRLEHEVSQRKHAFISLFKLSNLL